MMPPTQQLSAAAMCQTKKNLFCLYLMMMKMECGNFYAEKHMKQMKQE